MSVEDNPGGLSPKAWGALLGFGSLVLFFLFVALDDPARGVLSAFSFFAIAMSVLVTWKSRNYGWYAPLIAGISLVHVIAIWLIPWQWRSVPALMFLPVIIVEIWLIALAVSALDKGRG
ncbi:MAG: hypothetical protein U5M50_09840 [Sphingobium sp.]|nr:hypothetical protein [Sphingobium sp.]